MKLKTPKIGEYVRGLGKLVEVKMEPPPPQPPPRKVYIFEEVTARAELRINSETISTGGTFWEYNGQGMAVVESIEEAKVWAKRLKITSKHTAEIVVVQRKSKVRKRESPSSNFYSPEYKGFSESLGYSDDHELKVVWSTKSR